MAEEEIGKITHFFPNINVAVVKLKGNLKTGEIIHIKGGTTDFTQKVGSMQVEHKNITEAKKGDDIGIKVDNNVKEHDAVFKVD